MIALRSSRLVPRARPAADRLWQKPLRCRLNITKAEKSACTCGSSKRRRKPIDRHTRSGARLGRPGEFPGSVQVCRLFQLPTFVPAFAMPITARLPEIVAIGVDRVTGEEVSIDIKCCRILIVICGASRSGKSVLSRLLALAVADHTHKHGSESLLLRP